MKRIYTILIIIIILALVVIGLGFIRGLFGKSCCGLPENLVKVPDASFPTTTVNSEQPLATGELNYNSTVGVIHVITDYYIDSKRDCHYFTNVDCPFRYVFIKQGVFPKENQTSARMKSILELKDTVPSTYTCSVNVHCDNHPLDPTEDNFIYGEERTVIIS